MEKQYIEAIVKEIDSEQGIFTAMISSGKKDRVGDILNPEGWNFSEYKKNPIILWAHDQSQPPVARAEKIWQDEKGNTYIKGKWAPTPFAQELRKLVEGGFLNALSVGFIPDEEPELTRNGRKFNKQTLLEVSWVNVPALADALVVARKMQLPLMVKALSELQEKECPSCKTENITLESIKDAEEITEIKPYPNEHACRLENPDKYKRFRRRNCFRKSDGKCIDYIFGIKESGGEEVVEVQSLRYPADEWTESAAKNHCSDAGGSFEPASKNYDDLVLKNKKLIENSIEKMEEAISALKEILNPEKGTTPSQKKGRETNLEKSKIEAELKILSMVDKALEILRHRIIKQIKNE